MSTNDQTSTATLPRTGTAATANISTPGIYDTATYCFYRLPCGYCSYMSRPCPMQGSGYTPIVTCQANGEAK